MRFYIGVRLVLSRKASLVSTMIWGSLREVAVDTFHIVAFFRGDVYSGKVRNRNIVCALDMHSSLVGPFWRS